MTKMRVGLVSVIALCFGCSDSLGPGINGRWATTGIELVGSAGGAELRLPCVRPVRLPWWTSFDATGHIQFSGSVRELWYSYDFVFAGQLQSDTLAATLTVSVPSHPSSVMNYRMTPDGDSGLDRMFCLA